MRYNVIILFTLILVFAGCSKQDTGFTKVEGTITYNGEAVEGATIIFSPTDSSGESATGKTDANGKFTLTTAGAQNAGSGVKPGTYNVLVKKVETTQTSDPDVLAEQRREITSEELRRRLAAKGLNAMTAVKIEHKQLLPVQYGQPSATPLKATVQQGRVSKHDFDLTD
jgi:hypothetical protein